MSEWVRRRENGIGPKLLLLLVCGRGDQRRRLKPTPYFLDGGGANRANCSWIMLPAIQLHTPLAQRHGVSIKSGSAFNRIGFDHCKKWLWNLILVQTGRVKIFKPNTKEMHFYINTKLLLLLNWSSLCLHIAILISKVISQSDFFILRGKVINTLKFLEKHKTLFFTHVR